MRRSERTPIQLAVLLLLGTLMMACCYLLASEVGQSLHLRQVGLVHSGFIVYVIALAVFFGSGAYLSIWAQEKLRNGVQSDRWNDTELSPVRVLFGSWPARIGPWVLIGTGLVMILVDSAHPHHGFMQGFWVCFLLNQGLMSLTRSLTPSSPSQPISWLQSSMPLRSDHWGHGS